MLRLAPPPPPVRVEPRHRYADLLGAVSLALSVCTGGEARAQAGEFATIIPIETDDAWARDIGPTFVTNGIEARGISQVFAGLVIVAIAGNAVEHAVGIQLAWRGKAELAVSVVLNSALQVAVALIPILILVSLFIGGTPFTLAIPPLLAIAVGLAILVVTIVTVDGEADMTDGAALCGLYVIIAALFWWG